MSGCGVRGSFSITLGRAPLVFACGCGFGVTNVATKLFGDDINVGHYVNALVWAVVALAAGSRQPLPG